MLVTVEAWGKSDKMSFEHRFQMTGGLGIKEENNVLLSSYVSCFFFVQVRELKSVFVDAVCSFIKLVVHQNHINHHNIFNQVSVCGIALQLRYQRVFLSSPSQTKYLRCWLTRSVFLRWGLCASRHGIQASMEAILACHPALSTKWLDWVVKWCQRWCMCTGPCVTSFSTLCIRAVKITFFFHRSGV